MSVNKIILVGRLGTDPELKDINGSQVCSMRLATSERYTDRDGQQQEKTEWHSVDVWGRQAESCARYLAKGREVYVEGKLTSREATNRDGVQARYWSVKAQTVQFIGGRSDGQQQGQGYQANRNQGNQGGGWNQRQGNRGGGWNEPQNSRPQNNQTQAAQSHSDPIPF